MRLLNARNPFLRKGWSLTRKLTKKLHNHTPVDLRDAPPILVNSLPKSGTHLLLQIVAALPTYTSYGEFIATTPSLTMRRRPDSLLARKLHDLVPSEVCPAHLHFSSTICHALRNVSAISLFIYRDPRDVFWSEMQYLLYMNKWHRASRAIRRLQTAKERFEFLLYGNDHEDRWPFEWPRFLDRVTPYLGWLHDAETFTCRFEDFSDNSRSTDLLERLTIELKKRSRALQSYSDSELLETLRRAPNPTKSHTFRRGTAHEWKTGLSSSQIMQLEREISPLRGLMW